MLPSIPVSGRDVNLSFLPQSLQQLFLLLSIHLGILCEILYHKVFSEKIHL